MEDYLQPWEQQPGETSRQFAAFAAYRDLGPHRSLSKAYGTGRRAPGSWCGWAATLRWVERAQAFDDAVERQCRQAREAKLLELACRREDFELAQQAEIEARADALGKKLTKLLEMPNSDVRLVKYNDLGEVIEEREVKGVRPSEIAALNREWRETVAQGVNGHVKVTRSGRLPEGDGTGGGSPSERMAIGVVWEKWHEAEEP